MNAKDRLILGELQRDGRLSNKVLASRVGLSPSACLVRVRRLEQLGAITGYGARVSRDVLALGFEAWATLTLSARNPASLDLLKRTLADERSVVEAYEVAATYDVLLHIVARDAGEWRGIEKRLDEAGLLGSVRIGAVTSELKSPSDWPLPREAFEGED